MTNPTSGSMRTRDLTVVVSSYNHQSYIEQCLDSIAAQTVPALQVIIIDDSSTDESPEVIRRWLADHNFPYTFISHNENSGVCATLNEAIALANGKYFCHVSGDDWEERDRFRRQVDYFETLDDSVALLVGDIREVDAGGSTIVDHDFSTRTSVVTQSASPPGALAALLAENVIPAPGAMLRTAALRSVGGFDESLAFEDYDMWMRLALDHAIAYRPGIVSNYRVVSSGLTRNLDRRVSVLTSEASMLAKHIGSTTTNNEIIVRRLLPIAGELMLLESVSGVRHVLREALAASDDPRIRSAYRRCRTKHGLNALARRHGSDFGFSPLVPSADTKKATHP